jgi:hypothetical protein
VAVLVLTALVPLPGCAGSADAGGQDDVASIAGRPGATATPSASSQNSGRPQFRLDTTKEEQWRIKQVWYHCLKDAGGKTDVLGAKTKGKPGAKPTDIMPVFKHSMESDPTFAEPMRACIGKQPLFPPELSPETNPHYADDFRDEVDCIRKAGLDVRPFKDEFGDELQYPANPPAGLDPEKITNECELKAFSK